MPWTLNGLFMERVFRSLSLVQPPTTEKIVFFGVRGAIPKSSSSWHSTLDGSKPVNYETMRCTIGQWWPHEKLEGMSKTACYLGSTVPTARYVESAADKGGRGTNLLLPGLYTFIRGKHREGTPTGHSAFRELGDKLICRTSDDGDYEPDSDLVEIDTSDERVR